MSRSTEEKEKIFKKVCNEVYQDNYSCDPCTIYYSDYDDIDWLNHTESFLAVVKYFLDTEKIFFEPPDSLYNVEKKIYKTKTKILKGSYEEFTIWDIPTDEMIERIREHMPFYPDGYIPYETDYWYGDIYFPVIIWWDYQEDEEK